mmetsp:Transcript_31731/g.56985  ORF Transcript_31731/g.56985 Transcript_31731/m.56985 type:complete len:88 (+) Transcript_31731:1106-1369(+)
MVMGTKQTTRTDKMKDHPHGCYRSQEDNVHERPAWHLNCIQGRIPACPIVLPSALPWPSRDPLDAAIPTLCGNMNKKCGVKIAAQQS